MYLLFYPKGHPCMQLRLGLTLQECPLVIDVLTTSFHTVLLQLAQILARVSNATHRFAIRSAEAEDKSGREGGPATRRQSTVK